MTSPCQNCHGAPATQPDSQENLFLQFDAGGRKSKETLNGDLKVPISKLECSAQGFWPEHLRTALPELQNLPWWVRSNFEKARADSDGFMGVDHQPIRVNIDRGKLSFKLGLEAGSFPLPKDSMLELKPMAQISGELKIRENRIPLWDQTLVEFARMEFHYDYYPGYLLKPVSVQVGNYGGLHFLSIPDSLLHFLTVPFMAPKIPVGHDFPTLSQEREKGGLDAHEGFLVYPNLKSDPLDLDLEAIIHTISPDGMEKIHRHFHDKHGRLPKSYNLEQLLKDIQALLAEPSGPKKNPNPLVAKLLKVSNLKSGKVLEIEIDKLKDFFWADVIDLGTSSMDLSVSLTPKRHWAVDLQNLDIKLDPMDYFQGEISQRSGIQLHSGSISTADLEVKGAQAFWQPGLHLDFDPVRRILMAQTQFRVNLAGRVPGLGEVELSGNLSGQTSFDLSGSQPKLIPQTTLFMVSDFDLKVGKDKIPLIQDLNFDISDLPPIAPSNPNSPWKHVDANKPTLYWGLNTRLKKYQLDLKGATQIPLDLDGTYDFQAFIESFLMEALGQLTTDAGKVFKGKFQYQSFVSPGLAGSFNHLLSFDLGFQKDSQTRTRTLLKDGQLRVKRFIRSEQDEDLKVSLGAQSFALDPVYLQEPEIQIAIERVQSDNGTQTIRLPVLMAQANPDGSNKGILKGRMQAKQVGQQPLEINISWNEEEKEIGIKNLMLAMNLQQFDFKPLLPAVALAAMNPNIDAVGVDGTLMGRFQVQFPTDYPNHRSRIRGWGDLLLRGDRRGDIYFVDNRGRMTGPPLVRDTMWHWRRVDGINFDRGYALGNFNLDTILNPGAILFFTGQPMPSGPTTQPVYGSRGQSLQPFEISAQMYHDNQPWNVNGFQNRIVDYLLALCLDDEACATGVRGGG